MKPNGDYYDMGVFSAVEGYKNYLDINYNYAILRELWSILVEIYSIRTK
jgi:hypothetical protein